MLTVMIYIESEKITPEVPDKQLNKSGSVC